MTPWHQGIPDSEWDKNLFIQGGHFTQSSHWAAVQSALGKKIFFASGSGWQCLAIFEAGALGSRVYAPYGPTAANARAFDVALSALKQLAKQEQAAYIRVEPHGALTAKQLQVRGLKQAPKDHQPRYTWVQDLAKPQEELLSQMSSTNRNLYRTASKKGLTFKQSRTVGDLPIFLDMIHEVAKHTGIKPYGDQTFQAIASALLPRNAAKLYIASHNNKPVASALVYDSPTTRYYAHAASYHEARKLHPGSPLLSTMIFDAKAAGQTEFDFFGIAPPHQPNHRWSGFTHFKQSFGGHAKTYLGTWELPTKTLHYAAYRLAHTAKGFLP
ncbi:MAG TPA: peptidoglycan bridge formation glycyltransferase FemA/FemB family protein [Candidatus Saccharimonadales bacterium]|nr:peptidoglycan bridge formation glycyltransferase FemA/FemB family protein [Candidatus Saccharimonadales bacterium]